MKGRVLFVGIWLIATGIALAAPLQIRVATYNASLSRSADGQLATDLSTPGNAQARQVAEIIQRVHPDIVLINEFDYDNANTSLVRFHDNYLAVSQNGQAPLSYSYRYAAPSNTGIASGFDLDNKDSANTTIPAPTASAATKERYGNDCFGFGWFPGQYGFVVYSRFPIQTSAIRTFQLFLWKNMPGAALPDDSMTPAVSDWYSPAELAVFRLSSKNHCDIPIELAPGHILHLLASHPTPPAFDGDENRNGRRNHDEIRLWADYLSNADYLSDDAGARGGFADEQRFLILGDLNADPFDGDRYEEAVNQLRNHPLINATFDPASPGGTQQAQLQGGANNSHQGNPAFDTSDFSDFSVGNLRVDHLLPSKAGLKTVGGGVFWPLNSDPTFSLVSASDHRLVFTDYAVAPLISQAVRNLAAHRAGADVVLTWGTQAGVIYRFQKSVNLIDWLDAPEIGINLDAVNASASATDAGGAAAEPARFYRLVTTLE